MGSSMSACKKQGSVIVSDDPCKPTSPYTVGFSSNDESPVILAVENDESNERESEHSASPANIPTIKNPYNKGEPHLLGVSVHWLRHGFLKEVQEAGLTVQSKIYEIEDLHGDSPGVIRRKGIDVTCPLSGRNGAAYVHSLYGEDIVGDATHMLSYTWGYSILDIVETLESFCESHSFNPKRTYFWICCLCVNQHQVVENAQKGISVPTDNFLQTFESRVLGIGRLVCMMDPFENPRYLRRVWCLFEWYSAMQNKCDVFVEMPPRERQRMTEELFQFEEDEGQLFSGLYEALNNTHVEKAEASEAADQEMILGLLSKAEGGFESVNVEINHHLRLWVRKSVLDFIAEQRSKVKQGATTELAFAQICNRVGLLFDHNGEHETAFELLREGLSIRERINGRGHDDTGSSMNNIAAALQNLGRLNESLSMYKEILERCNISQGRGEAAVHSNIGGILDEMGQWDEALEEHKTAIELLESDVGKDNPKTATVYNNIGSVLSNMGRYEDSLSKFTEALSIREATLGKEHPDCGASHNNIGSCLLSLGRHEDALREFCDALRVLEAILGPDHPTTGSTYNNIGLALNELGLNEEALEQFEKALAIQKTALGPQHLQVAATYNNVGAALEQLKRYKESLANYSKALDIEESTFGKGHPSTSNSFNNIAGVLYEVGMYDSALTLYRKSLKLKQVGLDESHPSIALGHANVAQTLVKMDKPTEALMEFNDALRIRKHSFGKEHPDVGKTHSSIGTVLHSMERFDNALGHFREALTIFEATLGKDHQLTKTSSRNCQFVKQKIASTKPDQEATNEQSPSTSQ